MTTPYRIGLIGGGTVGGGVYELVAKRLAASHNIFISHLCVRDLDKKRDFAISAAEDESTATTTTTKLTTNLSDLDDCDCIVEVAGGSSGPVATTVLAHLRAGQTIVTANKALLAEHLTEISSSLSSISKGTLGMEASVCGGIPIIHLLQTCYVADCISSIMGICNGTTNYMLCGMERGTNYDDILKQAQELGYAEADPTADVGGYDVRSKIALLSFLAFGTIVEPTRIPTSGITQITALDFDICQQHLQSTIKLLGCAQTSSSNSSGNSNKQDLSIYVAPHVVPLSHALSSIDGPGNCVTVVSENLGSCNYTGPGAGRYPTANSVAADIVRAATKTLPKLRSPSDEFHFVGDYTAPFYIRLPGEVVPLTSLPIAATLEHNDIKVLITEPAKHSEVKAFCESVHLPLYMPILKQ